MSVRTKQGDLVIALLLCGGLSLLWSCSSGGGGSNNGTVEGRVVNSITGEGIAGAIVTPDPVVAGAAPIVTDATGFYTATLRKGDYTLTYEAEFYGSEMMPVTVVGGTTSQDASLDPDEPVMVMAAASGDGSPDSDLSVTATVVPLDGSTLQTFTWTQDSGPDIAIADPTAMTLDLTLPDLTTYKEHLMLLLAEPPISADQLPPNVELPEGEFSGGTPDRFKVVGINPFILEEAAVVTFTATAVTDSGTYKSSVEVHTPLPWKPSPGLYAVPVGTAVLLHAHGHVDEDDDGFNDETGAPTTYDWALTPPATSTATLMDATSRNPYFTPDLPGPYVITVTDTTQLPGDEVITLNLIAGQWEGAITGRGADGRPEAEICTLCHNGIIAPDKFTAWRQSGHAEIFTDMLDTNSHYSEAGCFRCHTVGYDPDADNLGVDEASDFQAFRDSGLIANPGDNWTRVLADFPDTAQMANIQCENCHGPHNLSSHPDLSGVSRTSLSADVCATCHGEPLRHARYQQWQLSHHANYELAIEEGMSGSCSRCHTVNGFLAWLPILLDDDPLTDPTASVTVTWTENDIHPQTCATCHDPHNPGSTTGVGTNATVRISGDTPPLIAGFTATGVGRGAICMTCHNSRRGLRNDDNWADTVAAGDMARAPHGGAQADVLMGQNAYLVNTGIRANHSLVEDACVQCHMTQTPPPDLLSYNNGGTNHTFAASKSICANCHSPALTANGVQAPFIADMTTLKGLIESAILKVMSDQIDAGNSIALTGSVTVTDVSTIASLDFTETRGAQAVTVTFTDDSVVGPVRVSDIDVIDPVDTNLGDLYTFADDRLPRAGWNYVLAFNDGSKGVHNPTFTRLVLDASLDALNDILSP